MSIGVNLSMEDLEAVQRLYAVRWTATISNWKERDTDYCLWIVTCPNEKSSHITSTGQSLEHTITELLKQVFDPI